MRGKRKKRSRPSSLGSSSPTNSTMEEGIISETDSDDSQVLSPGTVPNEQFTGFTNSAASSIIPGNQEQYMQCNQEDLNNDHMFNSNSVLQTPTGINFSQNADNFCHPDSSNYSNSQAQSLRSNMQFRQNKVRRLNASCSSVSTDLTVSSIGSSGQALQQDCSMHQESHNKTHEDSLNLHLSASSGQQSLPNKTSSFPVAPLGLVAANLNSHQVCYNADDLGAGPSTALAGAEPTAVRPRDSGTQLRSSHLGAGPIAATATSRNVHPTVIIKPKDPEAYFSNPLKIYRIMQKTVFSDNNIVDTYRNLNKHVQVIKLNNPSLLEQCLKIKNIGQFEVECYNPFNSRFKVGLIGPIGTETTEDEFTELLNDSGFVNARARRLFKGQGRNAVITKTMKIYLEVDCLPEYVVLMRERFKVTQFIDAPYQCFNCQKFGHSAKNCRNVSKCVICSGNHKHSECQNKGIFKKCANCNGTHTSSYGGCEAMKNEKEIQKLKINMNMSYRDATIQYKTNMQTNVISNRTRPNHTYINSSPSRSTVAITRVDAWVQTDKESTLPVDDSKSLSSELNSQKPEVQMKLAICLLDILSSMNKADTLTKKCAMISRSFNLYLGSNIDQKSLLSEVKANNQVPSPSPVVSVPSKKPTGKNKNGGR